MNHAYTLFITGLFVVLSASADLGISRATGFSCIHSGVGASRGQTNPMGPIIWPWGLETSFPWTGIQGVWQVTGSDCSTLYVFRIVQESGSEKTLNISHYDPVSCQVISIGKGTEYNNVVRAVLAGRQGSYEMTIHAFRSADLSKGRMKSYSGTLGNGMPPVMVMRVFPLGSRPSDKATFRIERIEKNPNMLCE